MSKIQNIIKMLNKKYNKYGNKLYTINEPLTILEHSIQCAKYIKNSQFSNKYLIVSALLHDYGHIAYGAPIAPSLKIDDKHELIAEEELTKLGFPVQVTRPIGLHVIAKRYLYTINDDYELSNGSRLSLELQGGKMNDSELLTFENDKYYKDALLLRNADDNSKNVLNNDMVEIVDYEDDIKSVLFI